MNRPPKALVCSGEHTRHGRLTCYRAATWGVQAGGYWHGACSQHLHQVAKRLGGDGGRLVVQQAPAVVAALERVWARHQEQTTEAEALLDLARPLVQDSDRVWTARRLAQALAVQQRSCTEAVADQVLELLAAEQVVRPLSQGRYVPSSPPTSRTSPLAHPVLP